MNVLQHLRLPRWDAAWRRGAEVSLNAPLP